MSFPSSTLDRADAPLFSDGLGERVLMADGATGEPLQILRLRPGLTAVPSFEFAVRERTARLMNFRHAYYARVRRIDRIQVPGTLAVVSDHVDGTRLSDVLRVAHASGLQLDINAALCLLRQLVHAVALLHENARDASHGLIGPERLVVTPHARLVIVEHVLGSAVEQLQLGRERLWHEFRVAIPPSAGIARFDHRADVTGIGMTALALVLGRPIAAEEFPHGVAALLMQARERSSLGEDRPLSPAFRTWLGRALQLDVRRAFGSAPEALASLEETLAGDAAYMPAPISLEAFLSQYAAAALQPVPPRAAPGADSAPQQLPAAAAPIVARGTSGQPPVERAVSGSPASAPDDGAAVGDDLPALDDLIRVDDLQIAPERQPARRQDVTPAGASPSSRELQTVADGQAAPAPPPRPDEHAGDSTVATSPRGSRGRLMAAACVLLALGGSAYGAMRFYTAPAVVEELPGTLIVQSSPPGVEVFVDGVSRGMTPASISVPAGSHILELRGRGVPRVIPLNVPAGGQVSQYLEFADTPVTGMLVVHSQPAGAKVLIGGVLRGTAPLTIEDLEPGDHEVVLQNDRGSSRHVVTVLSGTTASLVAPVVAEPGGPVSGWITLKAPFTIEIREDGQLLGTSDTERIMLAAGRHELELVNQPLGFRQRRVLQVQPGKVTPVALDLPKGVVNLNASPWAEVWIDGRRIGETPIGNLELPIGPHEVVFRHPQFGEQRHALSVTTGAPARLSVAMQ